MTAWDYGRSLPQATREIRFAGPLAGGYARQDDASAVAAARDPQALRLAAAAASAALPAGQAEADRVSTFVLDRLGRETERRVSGVAVEDVSADGTRTPRVADAIVRTLYDGLGHVVQTRELLGDASDPGAWEVTEVAYDLLGRETSTRAPGFVDFEGTLVRATLDTEYDGLGQVRRRLQRGKTVASESDDRITTYRYDGNGRLVEERDAAGALTRYAYDATGHRVLRTAVGVHRADGTARDLGTRYAYDAAGRVIAETDLDTGELRRTRYNAFGEVAGRGLGDGWQEFAEYTTLGKVWKTNAGDGAVKITLHDRNGNTTREIRAAASVDLRPVGLAAASQDATLLHTTSLYDQRNLLKQTLEPEFQLLTSRVTLGQQFVEQWLPQYGDLNAAAAASQQASIQDGQRYTTVSAGAAALTPLNATAPGFLQSVDGIVLGAAPVQADPAVPAVMRWHALSYPLPSGTYQSSSASIRGFWTYIYLPDDWPAGEYRVTETANGDSVVLTSTAAPGGPVKIGHLHGSSLTRSLQFDYRFSATEPWAPIATAQYTKDMDFESYTVQWRGLNVSVQPNRRVVLDTQLWGQASAFKVVLDPDGGAPIALASKAFGTSTRFDAVDLPATLTGLHTLRIVALDAAGNVLVGGDYSLGTTATDANGNPLPADVATLAPKTASGLEKGTDGFVWVDYAGGTRTLRYQSSGTNLGTGVALRYRRAVTNGRGAWSGVALSGNAVDLKPLGLADGNYEFVVEFGGSNADHYRYGKFTVRGGSIVVPNSMLQRVMRRSELVHVAGPSGGTVTLTVGGYSASATVASGASSALVDLGALRQKLGIDRWSAGSAAYTSLGKDAAGKVTHVDRGVFTFGTRISAPSSDGGNAVAATDGVTEYQPEALLTIAGAVGRVVVTPKTGGGTSATWPADGSDWRVRRQGDGLVVNLRQWLPAWGAAANTVQLRYEGSDGLVATVDFTVAPNGTVARASTVVQQTNKPQLPLVVPGASALRVFKVGLDDARVDAATANEPVSGTGPGFVWNASARLGQTLRYYYEAVDAAGRLVGKGRGKVVIASTGDITQTPDAPLPIPHVRFSPPAGTAGFTLQIRPQGSQAAYAAYGNGWTSVNDRVYDFDSMRPASGTASYDYLFTALDAAGTTLTKGSGTLSIESDGATSVTHVEEHVAVPVLFRIGRQVAQAALTVERNGVRSTATLPGTWVPPVLNADGSPRQLGYTRFEWDAASMGSASGVTTYDYTLVAQDAAGNAVRDEIGRAVAQSGRIALDPDGSQPVQLLQQVETLNGSDAVVVSRLQSHNAFGEVVEERDERVADRMAAMLGRALTAAEQAAARTTLRYDTRGLLLSKTDPQTHITLANGYRYRDRPITRYGYDLLGRLTTVTDANGNLSRQLARAGTRGDGSPATAEFFADGGQRQTAYDVFGDARRVVDAEGHVVEQGFDRRSRLLQSDRRDVRRVIDGEAHRGAGATLTSRYGYDELGRRLRQTDAAGQTLHTDYDGLGRVVRTESAQGFETRYRYENIAAGAADGVLGVGGANVGGTRRTTTHADGRSSVDKIEYFGHTTWHQDLGGAQTVYAYDRAARLVSQKGAAHAGQPASQDIRYAYYANGFVQSVTDLAVGNISEYGYDDAGNRVDEAYFQLTADGQRNGNYQNATLSYDELNRLVGVRDANFFDIRYEYDANGNRRLVDSVYWDGLGGLRSGRQTYWYDYDGMDRFVITKGTLSGARATSRGDAGVRVVAGTEGTVLAYDRLGQRRSAAYSHDGQQVSETYSYSEDGYLETVSQGGVLKAVRELDEAGRTVAYHDKQNRTLTVSTYDRDSRLTQQVYTDAEHDENSGTTTYAYYSDASDSASAAGGAGAQAKTVFTPADSSGTTVTTNYRYVYWDEAKQSEIRKQADSPSLPTWYPGLSSLYYNANGHLERVWDQAAKIDTRYFNSANGLILKREKLQNHVRVGSHFYYYADARRVGDVSDDPSDNPRISYAQQLATKRDEAPDPRKLYKNFKPVGSADFDQNFEPINEGYPGATPSTYTVRDTRDLQGIALQVWGDRSMWYLIAEANGLRGDETLTSGQLLVIPNKVTNIHNNAETFRPYKAGEAVGRIDPTLPPAPRPQGGGGCGDIGIVMSVAIAIAVSAATGGAAGGLIAEALGVTAGTATTVAGYAAGAALGSVASQGFNIATGLQDGFSWRQVGQAALGGGIGGAVSQVAHGLEALAFLKDGLFAAAGRAVIGSGINQVLHRDWDWRGVMAAAVGAGVNATLMDAFGGVSLGTEAGRFGHRLIAAAAAATASRAAFGQRSRIDVAFGHALGSSWAEAVSSGSQQGQGTAASPYVDPYTGEHIVFDKPYQPDFPDVQQFVGAFGEGSVPPVNRSNEVLLAAGDGFTMGRGAVSIGQRGRTVYVTEQGAEPSIDAMLAKAQAGLRQLQQMHDEALTAQLNRNSVIRETVTPILEPMTVEVPSPVSEVVGGVGDVVTGAIAGLADMTVAPIADLAQTGLKALHGAVTGDYQPLSPMSSYADSVVNRGAGAWEGVRTTAVNVFNVSAAGMVYHAGTGGYGLTTATMNGDERAATREGIGLGLNFAGAAVPVGMARTPSTTSFMVQAEALALHRMAANHRAATPWADLRRAYQQARGQVDFAHIEADVIFKANGQVKSQGGHFSTSPQLQRIPGTETVSPNGVIYGQVRLLGPDGKFYLKTNNRGFSSMTPDSWSLARAKGEMSRAWINRMFDPVDRVWTGTSSSIDFLFHEPTNRIPMWRGYPIQP